MQHIRCSVFPSFSLYNKLMKKIFFSLFIFLVLILGVIIFVNQQNKKILSPESQNNPSQTSQQIPETTQLTTVATNLEVPWAIAFLPTEPNSNQGAPTILVTERAGRIQHVTSDGTKTLVATIDEVLQEGESGLHGITLHPKFATNNYVYVYYTYQKSGNNTTNRVVRYTFSNNQLTNKTIIVDNIPGALFHDGGRIKFGPDGFLYISTGDAQEPSLAQNKTALAGKILRVTDTGKPAKGNPFADAQGKPSLIYSYGHRNPQGIAWHSDGALWETEHGRSGALSGLDELNIIQSGNNYGWPTIEGNETRKGMITPRKNSGSDTWAPSGAAFINNSLFFSGLRGQSLYEATIVNNQVTEVKEHFKGQFGRIREVIAGPDGFLYISTSNRDGRGDPQDTDDKILRVNPDLL